MDAVQVKVRDSRGVTFPMGTVDPTGTLMSFSPSLMGDNVSLGAARAGEDAEERVEVDLKRCANGDERAIDGAVVRSKGTDRLAINALEIARRGRSEAMFEVMGGGDGRLRQICDPNQVKSLDFFTSETPRQRVNRRY